MVLLIYLKFIGLDIPINTAPIMTKELAKKREDELTEYFLYEMRKKPV